MAGKSNGEREAQRGSEQTRSDGERKSLSLSAKAKAVGKENQAKERELEARPLRVNTVFRVAAAFSFSSAGNLLPV